MGQRKAVGGLFILLAVMSGAAQNRVDNSFANTLFQNEEYEQAALEFERLLFFHPNSDQKDQWQYCLGLSRKRSGQCNKAIEDFGSIAESSAWRDSAKMGQAECCLESGRAAQALNALEGMSTGQALFTKGYARLLNGEYAKAARDLGQIGAGDEYAVRGHAMAQAIDSLVHFKTKHYAPAGLLALFPGLGHVYAGRCGDALFSFSVIGSFGGIAYYYYYHDAPGRAAFVGTITGLFYAGSVYGALVSVKLYNRKEPERLQQSAKRIYEGK
jgi:tetratricopeptide (TPR) repeat protein